MKVRIDEADVEEIEIEGIVEQKGRERRIEGREIRELRRRGLQLGN